VVPHPQTAAGSGFKKLMADEQQQLEALSGRERKRESAAEIPISRSGRGI
jgi:hypothetical protein